MSKMQRTKGASFERDIVNVLKEHGYEAGRNLTQTRVEISHRHETVEEILISPAGYSNANATQK